MLELTTKAAQRRNIHISLIFHSVTAAEVGGNMRVWRVHFFFDRSFALIGVCYSYPHSINQHHIFDTICDRAILPRKAAAAQQCDPESQQQHQQLKGRAYPQLPQYPRLCILLAAQHTAATARVADPCCTLDGTSNGASAINQLTISLLCRNSLFVMAHT